jgi:hypothetical protein
VTSSNKEARRKRDKSIPSSGPIDSSLSIFVVKVCGVVGSKTICTWGIVDIGGKTVKDGDSGKRLSSKRVRFEVAYDSGED